MNAFSFKEKFSKKEIIIGYENHLREKFSLNKIDDIELIVKNRKNKISLYSSPFETVNNILFSYGEKFIAGHYHLSESYETDTVIRKIQVNDLEKFQYLGKNQDNVYYFFIHQVLFTFDGRSCSIFSSMVFVDEHALLKSTSTLRVSYSHSGERFFALFEENKKVQLSPIIYLGKKNFKIFTLI